MAKTDLCINCRHCRLEGDAATSPNPEQFLDYIFCSLLDEEVPNPVTGGIFYVKMTDCMDARTGSGPSIPVKRWCGPDGRRFER